MYWNSPSGKVDPKHKGAEHKDHKGGNKIE
jgi:hypothetical protein